MSLTGTYQITITANGTTCLGIVAKTAATGIEPVDTTLTKGNAGTLTRSDADTGVVTLTAGHTITTADTVDVYWEAGIRYGMTATANGTVTDSFVVDGGAGDDLPTDAEIAVVITEQQVLDITFDGDNLQVIGASASQRANVVFYHDATVILAQEIVANGAWGWASLLGVTNPLAGDAVTSITASCGSSPYDAAFKLTGLQA